MRIRRNFLDLMMRISAIKEKNRQEEERALMAMQRMAFVASVLLVCINTLLVLDVYVLPIQNKADVAESLMMIKAKKGNADFRMSTREGRHIYIDPQNYGKAGDSLLIRTTVIFNIPKEIFLSKTEVKIERIVNGFGITQVCAPLLLCIGLFALLFRKKVLNDHYIALFFISAMATAQIIGLIM